MIYMDEDIESSDSDWVEEEDDGEELKNMSLLRVGLLFFTTERAEEATATAQVQEGASRLGEEGAVLARVVVEKCSLEGGEQSRYWWSEDRTVE